MTRLGHDPDHRSRLELQQDEEMTHPLSLAAREHLITVKPPPFPDPVAAAERAMRQMTQDQRTDFLVSANADEDHAHKLMLRMLALRNANERLNGEVEELEAIVEGAS